MVGKAELVKQRICILSGKYHVLLWPTQLVTSTLRLLGNETITITVSLKVIKPQVLYHSCCFFFLDSTNCPSFEKSSLPPLTKTAQTPPLRHISICSLSLSPSLSLSVYIYILHECLYVYVFIYLHCSLPLTTPSFQ